VTSPCAEVREQAVGLASLHPDDPERVRAFAHAATCLGCAAALNEGQAVLALLDGALQVEPLGSEALLRTKQRIRREGPTKPIEDGSILARPSPRPPFVGAGGVTFVGLLLLTEWALMTFKHWRDGAEVFFSAALAVTAAAVAGMSLRRQSGAATLIPLPVLSLAVALLSLEGTSNAEIAMGLKCAMEVVAASAAPLVLVLALASRGRAPRPDVAVAAVAGGGALIGQAALRIGCHAQRSATHVVLFHSLPVVVMVVLGFAIGSVILARRRPPASFGPS